MKGYLDIPKTFYVKHCKDCGARPIIAMVNNGEYEVKCPISDNHYHTEPGLIDIAAWNRNNDTRSSKSYSLGKLTLV